MEAVVTTDWHLDVLNNGVFRHDPEQGIKLQIKDIEKPFEYALENGIKNIIVAGDIGQHCELSSLAKFYLLSLLMKYDSILDIHIIPGNHDYNKVGVHSLKLVELLCEKNKFNSVYLYTDPTLVEIEGTPVYFLPYPHTKGKKNVVNVAHLDPNGARRDNGKKITNGCDLLEDTQWIVGHLHTYQNFGNLILPGTLYQCNFGESLPKGFLHVKAGKKFRHRFIEVKPSFTFNTILIESSDDWTQISRNEREFYRVYVQSSLTVPEDIYQYPNILQLSGQILEGNDDRGEGDDRQIKLVEDDEELLAEYLKQVYTLNKGEVRRSLSLIKRARTRLGLTG